MTRPTKAESAWWQLQAAKAAPGPRASQYRHPAERCGRFGCESLLTIVSAPDGAQLACRAGHYWGKPTAADHADWRRG